MALDDRSVLVAMSGGVDSSVAAALLLREGYRVTGIFMCLGTAAAADGDSRGCCSPQDAADARRVAEKLGIELYVLNLAGEFGPIIDTFVDEYLRGRTPNPCILCNSRLKFGRLMHHADSLGVRYVATGHYARVARDGGGQATIARGLARGKDQSYALFEVAPQCVARMLLPVGEIAAKDQVRAIARELGLITHDKPDSQEICFVPDDDYAAFLRGRIPEAFAPGEIVDAGGKVLGVHSGYAGFTIGQRKGLRVAAGVPMYVTAIDPATRRVTLGTREQGLRQHLRATRATWHRPMPGEFDATVQIRYNHAGAPARVRVTAHDSFEASFAEPLSAITPGQAAVVYDGDTLLGGAWIEAAW